jgi:hypothetical protein
MVGLRALLRLQEELGEGGGLTRLPGRLLPGQLPRPAQTSPTKVLHVLPEQYCLLLSRISGHKNLHSVPLLELETVPYANQEVFYLFFPSENVQKASQEEEMRKF